MLHQQLATQSQLASADKAQADAQAALAAQQNLGAGKALERVVAPYDGLVSSVAALSGTRLPAGAALLQLISGSGLQVRLGVEPGDAVQLRSGLPVQIVAVFDAGHTFSGRVTQVFGMINPQTQLVDVLVALPDANLLLGTQVRAAIQLSRQLAYAVPRSAVLRDAQGAYLFQVQQGKARRVTVQTGLEQAGLVAVSGKLIANAPVVSLGNYELQDGMTVRGAGQ